MVDPLAEYNMPQYILREFKVVLVVDVDDNDDNNNDAVDCDNDDDDGDIYIMMKCVSVCLSQKIISSHFRAERRRREVSRPLGLAGRRPALA